MVANCIARWPIDTDKKTTLVHLQRMPRLSPDELLPVCIFPRGGKVLLISFLLVYPPNRIHFFLKVKKRGDTICETYCSVIYDGAFSPFKIMFFRKKEALEPISFHNSGI